MNRIWILVIVAAYPVVAFAQTSSSGIERHECSLSARRAGTVHGQCLRRVAGLRRRRRPRPARRMNGMASVIQRQRRLQPVHLGRRHQHDPGPEATRSRTGNNGPTPTSRCGPPTRRRARPSAAQADDGTTRQHGPVRACPSRSTRVKWIPSPASSTGPSALQEDQFRFPTRASGPAFCHAGQIRRPQLCRPDEGPPDHRRHVRRVEGADPRHPAAGLRRVPISCRA